MVVSDTVRQFGRLYARLVVSQICISNDHRTDESASAFRS